MDVRTVSFDGKAWSEALPALDSERTLVLVFGASELGDSRPAIDELAKATGLKKHHVEEALDAVEASVSLNQAVGSDGDGELGDLFADRTAVDPVEEADEVMQRERVRTALAGLPERERRVLELRHGRGHTLVLVAP